MPSVRKHSAIPIIFSFLCALFTSVNPAGAETLRHWIGSAPSGRIGITVLPVNDGKINSGSSVQAEGRRGWNPAGRHWDIPSRPAGGHVGTVSITSLDGKPLPSELHVRLVYCKLTQDDLDPAMTMGQYDNDAEDTRHAGKKHWHLPMGYLAADAWMRADPQVREYVLKPSQTGPVSLPLILPPHVNNRGINGTLFCCLCEVTDSEGHPLSRTMPVEAFSTQACGSGRDNAWVMEEVDADRKLRELAGVTPCVTVREFPPVISPYFETKALWLTQAALSSNAISTDMLRRIMMSGTWAFGSRAATDQLTETCGVGKDGIVLFGGAAALEWKALKPGEDHEKVDISWDSQSLWQKNLNCNYNAHRGEEPKVFPLENRRDLFKGVRAKYIRWTLGIVFGFGVALAVGLPLGFRRLKGSRRLLLWWAMPVVSIAFALIAFLGGMQVLPRKPAVDIREYRFAYADWPEVMCQTVCRQLTFDDSVFDWNLAPGAVLAPGRGPGEPFSHISWTEQGTKAHMAGIARGSIHDVEWIDFRKMPVPVKIAWKENKPLLEAGEGMTDVYVWSNGIFTVIGAFSAGEQKDPSIFAKTNHICGLPQRIGQVCRSSWNGGSRCGNCTVESLPIPGMDVFSTDTHTGRTKEPFDSWFVIGRSSEKPVAAPASSAKTDLTSGVIWVVQLPLIRPGGNPVAK